MSKKKIPEAWKHLEPGITINGTVRQYYLHCQRCFKPKGHTNRKYCLSCRRREPRVIGLKLLCPDCKHIFHRNAIILALYIAGGASTDIGKLFNISATSVLNIVKNEAAQSKNLQSL